MSAVVKRIIDQDRAVIVRVSDFQKRRIVELKEMLERKKRGEKVDTSEIVRRWQAAGILDANGDLASPYRNEE